MKNYFLKILCKILQKCGIFEFAKLKNCKINNLTQHIPHLDKSKTTNWCTLSFIITISILLTRVWGIWTIVITLKQRHVELCNQSTQDFLFKNQPDEHIAQHNYLNLSSLKFCVPLMLLKIGTFVEHFFGICFFRLSMKTS